MSQTTIAITYILTFEDEKSETFEFCFDATDMRLHLDTPDQPPSWTRLDFHQCPNCSLHLETCQHCPPAVSLSAIVNQIGDMPSYEGVEMRVITQEREIRQKTTIQNVLSSMLGLIMASSDCPIASYFRPMARFHLPLANLDETIFRATSTYLLAQYFRAQKDLPFDASLGGLVTIYKDMQTVNSTFAERLRQSGEVSETNAIAQLDINAQTLPVVISDNVDDLYELFSAYLTK